MKTKYRYINFQELEKKPKTSVWGVFNNKSDIILGVIKWYPQWRQYCFLPADAVFNNTCLLDIIDFIKQISKQLT